MLLASELHSSKSASNDRSDRAAEPHGNELLRAICIMSMVPRRLLSPTIIKAKQLAYEIGMGGDGSVMAREGEAERLLEACADDPEGCERRKQRHFADASPVVRRTIGDRFDFPSL